VLHFPYAAQLTAAEHADAIAWVEIIDGAQNVWAARGPAYSPVKLTNFTDDDGQEISQLNFSADASRLIFVRGGDHDANWSAEGNLAPDPSSAPEQPVTAIWSVPMSGGVPEKLAEGDSPAISAQGSIAFIKEDHVWSVPISGGVPARLFFDRGKDRELRWSPNGAKLAFVSDRGTHSFIGIYTTKTAPLVYLAPSTNQDGSPRWSPDGTQVAFVRRGGNGGPPEPILTQVPHPWSIWVASAADGSGRSVWQSPNTLAGSYPDVEGEANLHWVGDHVIFLAYLADWPHLYSVPAAGGEIELLTPGAYMVEHLAASRDHQFVIYDANAGTNAGDQDRRHIFRVSLDRVTSAQITTGDSMEWTPVSAGQGKIAFIAADARTPPSVVVADADGSKRINLTANLLPADFPAGQLVVPKPVSFRAADGAMIHGQLFDNGEAKLHEPKPGIIFVHGGPPRQMLLGWHYMHYYSNAYAVNQYLATHGFVVLAVNYRLGIGYGRAFHQAEHAGPAGASEYQDVLAGAQYLQGLSSVDAKRIGIWGGSYGGYLTGLALARNSDVFKAGVDLHGVHDWSRLVDEWAGKTAPRYEKGDRDQAMESAWKSSPDADIESWKSPVLLIHGDDDRNVPFQQTVDLARRLEARQVPFEELVIPNEIHGFLRQASWAKVDAATVSFLSRKLGVPEQ
jgi:dipeptidyl aminopeptidase/acylaminoacyl peptidase